MVIIILLYLSCAACLFAGNQTSSSRNLVGVNHSTKQLVLAYAQPGYEEPSSLMRARLPREENQPRPMLVSSLFSYKQFHC